MFSLGGQKGRERSEGSIVLFEAGRPGKAMSSRKGIGKVTSFFDHRELIPGRGEGECHGRPRQFFALRGVKEVTRKNSSAAKKG